MNLTNTFVVRGSAGFATISLSLSEDKARGSILSAYPLRLFYKRRIQEGHFTKICVGHFMDRLFEIEMQGVARGQARVWPTGNDA